MPCGIMDQYVSAMGAEGHLLLINCTNNESQLIPFGSSDSAKEFCLVVTNSNVKHKLSDSEYPLRVEQCQEALSAIKSSADSFKEISSLAEASMEMLYSCRDSMAEVAFMRARHCIGEDLRTTQAVDALKNDDFTTVGRLMTESHVSLRDDYQV